MHDGDDTRRATSARTLLAAALFALVVAGGVWSVGLLERAEHDTLDLRFRMRPAEPPREIAVVAVDDISFSALKRPWPFPRSLFGRAADRLRAAGAAEIVFDVQFTEPTKPAEDFALYDAIDRAGGAVLSTSESDERGRTNVLGGDANLHAIGARAAAANLPDGSEGVVRTFAPAMGKLATVATVTARRAGKKVDPRSFDGGEAWIDFRGPPKTVPTYSFSDLLAGRVDPRKLRGKIVVVGASAPTVQDVHPVPTSSRGLMSGPEIQANAIWTALHGLPLRSAPAPVDVLAFLLLVLAVPLLALRVRMLYAALAAPLLALAYAALAHGLFLHGTVVAVVAPLFGLAVATVAAVTASHVSETFERRRVAGVAALLERKVRERTLDLRRTQLEVVQRLACAVDLRDEDTGRHIDSIGNLCRRLAEAAGLPPDEVELLHHASALHDVGKLVVPDHILRKPGKLDAEEWRLMQRHTTAGADLLAGSDAPVIQLAETIARTHHERWDGTGYPNGLAGEDIPLAGRICALCDVYDALVSERPYKRAWSHEEAITEIAQQAGRHFDPRLTALFVELLGGDATVAPPPVRLAA